MKQIRKIKEHEMLKRWAIAEVYVEHLNSINEDRPGETLRLLHSNNEALQKLGIGRALKDHHLSLVDCLPSDITWYLAELELKQQEFDRLYTLPVPDLAKITNDTFQVSSAAKNIAQNAHLNTRILEIREAFKLDRKKVQLSGITLLAKDFKGPYTIIEGNGRLISLYSLLFLEENRVLFADHISIVIGISDAEFGIKVMDLD